MKLNDEQQAKLFNVLCCLMESVGSTFNHVSEGKKCDCQICLDLESAQNIIDEIDAINPEE
jgi:hypothetical protein